MNVHIKSSSIITLSALLIACGGGDDLESKKAELAKLRSESVELNGNIKALEDEIAVLDPEFGQNSNNIILVSTMPVSPSAFEHKIETRGTVESRKNVMVSAEIGGRIEEIKVREGQNVKKGQVLLVLDAEIIRNNIAELRTSLELATVVFQRQSNLWEKKIGTEIQYLEAKNMKESLERRLATTESQMAQSVMRAPFAGSIDEIPSKVGEMAAPGSPLLRIVNPNDMYINADVSESLIGKLEKGEEVEVHFPSQNKNLVSRISSVGQVINKENRTFSIEIELPQVGFTIKPNQVTVLKLRDYTNESAFVVPTKIIQRDDKGTYVFGVETEGQARIAKKIHVETGLSYESRTEIVSGLVQNEQIIDRGFREVTEGVEVQIATAETAKN